MCGFSLACSEALVSKPSESLLDSLNARGPDCVEVLQRSFTLPSSSGKVPNSRTFFVSLIVSVLGLRGKAVQCQPMMDPDSGLLFVWNGEAFTWGANAQAVSGNDTCFVFQQILKSLRSNSRGSRGRNIAHSVGITLSRVSGPFTFLVLDPLTRCIFYGRDVLGRKSLVTSDAQAGGVVISSVVPPGDPGRWKEVDPAGFFVCKLSGSGVARTFHAWSGFAQVG